MIQINVLRGNYVESIHKVKALILNAKEKSIYSTGNNKDITYPRSAIKILQAIPLIISGASEFYNLNEKQIALSSSSHFGETLHIKNLNNWLKKIELNKSALLCGIHNPLNLESSNKLLLSKNKPTTIYNNCSGKHLGMLTTSKYMNFPIKSYIKFNHPLQKIILNILEEFCDYKIKNKNKAIDGCSLPQYALPLENLALAMLKISFFYKLRFDLSLALNKLIYCIFHNPFYIGGSNRIDSQIIKITKGRIFCKVGAEGVIMFSDMEKNIGGILKVEDGNQRVLPIAIIEILKKIKSISFDEYDIIRKLQPTIIKNYSNKKVGSIKIQSL